jgi:plastocyanin
MSFQMRFQTAPNRTCAVLLCASLFWLCGCKPDKALKRSEVIGKGTYPSTSGIISPDAGAVTGTVSFRGTPPARIPIDMSMDPACSMSAAPNDSEQYVVHEGKLENVYITVRSGVSPSVAPAGTPPVVMDQKGCRYVPHVIALQQGGSVEFRNSDPTMHNIHAVPVTAGDQGIDISQAPGGAPQSQQFNMPETMMPVRCNNHPWMNAFINVSQTPYFAVTGADGSFKLAGLPPGHYTIAAIHEKLGEQDIDVTVPARGVAKADFAFSMK